jgi:hypothetical protein
MKHYCSSRWPINFSLVKAAFLISRNLMSKLILLFTAQAALFILVGNLSVINLEFLNLLKMISQYIEYYRQNRSF